MSLPPIILPHAPPPPAPGVTENQAGLPVLYSSFPLAGYFTHGSVYVSTLLSQFVPPSPSPAVMLSLHVFGPIVLLM